jgi:DNA-binding transcriptional ArsR family regulator
VNRSRPDPPSPPSLEDVDIVFAALAHPARRHVLLLLSHLGGELSSGYLAARFQHSWPTTTRHLKVLEEAGLVEVHREGRSSHYRLNRERLQRVLGGWQRHLEPIGPEQKWTSSGPKSTDGLGDTTRRRGTKITEETKNQHPPKGNRR